MSFRLGSTSFKGLILFTLTLSTSTTVLLMRMSRLEESDPSKVYLPSTVVFVTECVKFFICFLSLLFFEGLEGGFKSFWEDILKSPVETSRLAVPAGLYALQNNLLYLALTHLDSATYQVTYQLKILSTAIFSVLLLERRLKVKQWLSLMLLSFGVMLVQISSQSTASSPVSSTLNSHKTSQFLGIVSVLGACLTSGISGVYFELLVKQSAQKSVLIRNLQLGVISVPMTLIGVLLEDSSKTSFFQGYNKLTLGIITLQSLGGLLVALVVKYADNILKGFSTSISIIICAICSYLFIERNSEPPGFLFYIGTGFVVVSTFLYSIDFRVAAKITKEPKLLNANK